MKEIEKSHLDPGFLKNLTGQILDEAKKQGATQAEVDIGMNKGFTVTVRQGDVETIEYNRDKMVTVTVYFGKRMGSSSLSDIRPDAIHSAVQAACNIARYADEDPFTGLAEKELMAFNYPDIALSFPWNISVEKAIELGQECETIALQADKRISNSEGVDVSTVEGWSVYGNSHGFIGVSEATRHDISCVLIAKQNDRMERNYFYTVNCDPALLDSIEHVARTAAERTVRRLGARRLTTRRAPVIFIAEEARSLIGHFLAAVSGSNLYRKSSFLLDHLNKKIFPSHIKIYEQPHLPKRLGSSPFDDDGVLTRPNVFVEEGILRSYILGTYSARKLGMQTTANSGGVHNLFIDTSNYDLTALLKQMGTGLLVTELMGHGTNIVTGDYSRGASGFWVENGEIQYPVEEITVAGNLKEMFERVALVGNDVDKRGNVQTGSILIEEMMIAGD